MAKEPVFEVAPLGKSLDTCTDEEKIFSSKFESLKIAHRGEVDPWHDEPQTFEYEHGLDYAPGFFVSNGIFNDSDIGGFVGQYSRASDFEAPFYCTDTIFYYWTACKFFLFYQDAE